jgi:hypothetical protein
LALLQKKALTSSWMTKRIIELIKAKCAAGERLAISPDGNRLGRKMSKEI